MKVLVIVSAVLAVAAAQYALPYQGFGYSGNPYAAGYGFAAPYSTYNAAPYTYAAAPYTSYNAAPFTTYAAAPYNTYAAAAPVAVSSQYHAQDAIGSYSYGYADGLSTKSESKNAYGATVGSYSYVDANGLTQTVNYVADAAGFRVQGTNLPVAPVANLEAPVNTLVGPAPVDDTAEVKAAKAEFRKLYDEAAAAAEAAPDSRKKRNAPLPVSDTPEVAAAKVEHARLYNAAAAAAAAAPDADYPVAYAGYGYAPAGYAAYGVPAFRAAAPAGFSYGFSSAHLAQPFYGRHFY